MPAGQITVVQMLGTAHLVLVNDTAEIGVVVAFADAVIELVSFEVSGGLKAKHHLLSPP